MSSDQNRNTHEFVVADVQLADNETDDGVALMLTDARGGRVRLHLNGDMAELLRERVAFALDRNTGP
ncbi:MULTISPECIES: hypothetical protein [Mesorhizobium]|uniref:Uncharacterized protein n=2 Tax=Mesorhizobium TaxID=68287 RepID=A0A2P9AMC5_9HYPH|nr:MULTISPECIES: hypothetical protein [Mesorhizobium]RWH74987.1 MAG: hypothetical protein EOQ85_23965 [Mesorhizobium sp.]RWH79051.1 MAG: hypothetical protein EOQ86_23535 [Mesorhizobium sp.]RWH88238.1 MAG: hypothetical protein EOQ87_22870 [Mesorhizobium sp.]RWH94785.1 MAG: hypothetical protein EOQ88_25020 [Mesorhizobium sp.]RWH98708.1 MAG: hypothetical protein EOQ89_22820 [Mesorhizobium sp.]